MSLRRGCHTTWELGKVLILDSCLILTCLIASSSQSPFHWRSPQLDLSNWLKSCMKLISLDEREKGLRYRASSVSLSFSLTCVHDYVPRLITFGRHITVSCAMIGVPIMYENASRCANEHEFAR